MLQFTTANDHLLEGSRREANCKYPSSMEKSSERVKVLNTTQSIYFSICSFMCCLTNKLASHPWSLFGKLFPTLISDLLFEASLFSFLAELGQRRFPLGRSIYVNSTPASSSTCSSNAAFHRTNASVALPIGSCRSDSCTVLSITIPILPITPIVTPRCASVGTAVTISTTSVAIVTAALAIVTIWSIVSGHVR